MKSIIANLTNIALTFNPITVTFDIAYRAVINRSAQKVYKGFKELIEKTKILLGRDTLTQLFRSVENSCAKDNSVWKTHLKGLRNANIALLKSRKMITLDRFLEYSAKENVPQEVAICVYTNLSIDITNYFVTIISGDENEFRKYVISQGIEDKKSDEELLSIQKEQREFIQEIFSEWDISLNQILQSQFEIHSEIGKLAADHKEILSKLTKMDKTLIDLATSSETIPLDNPIREYRLLKALQSQDRLEVERAMESISGHKAPKPWLINYLKDFVKGEDESLAKTSIRILAEMGRYEGINSADVMIRGLESSSSSVRSYSVFQIGEMALFGGRKNAQKLVGKLIQVMNDPQEEIGLLEVAVHTLGKIGGNEVFNIYLDLLESQDKPLILKTKALETVSSLWIPSQHLNSAVELYDEFVDLAIEILEAWPEEQCREIHTSRRFEFLADDFKDAIKKCMT